MTRDEWHAYIESVPLTEYQLGRIHREAERLGLADRAERLAVTAALAGRDELDSTYDLTQGQAGRVVRALIEARDRAELPALAEPAGDDDQGDDEPAEPALPIGRALMLAFYMVMHPAEAERVLQLAAQMGQPGASQ